jgi:hypothetical protein
MIIAPHVLAFILVLVFTLVFLIFAIRENAPASSAFWAWLGVLTTCLALLY